MSTSTRWRTHTIGQRRFFRSLSTTLPPWSVLLVALAIGLAAAFGINQIDEQERRASEAQLVATQLGMQSAKALNVYERYLRMPDQGVQLTAEYEAIQVGVYNLVLELGELAPGPEQAMLATTLQELQIASLSAPPSDPANPDDTYLNEVMLPIANRFFGELQRAQDVYRDEARLQEQRARVGTFVVLIAAALLAGILFALNERLRRNQSAILERQELRFRALVQHGTDLISLIDKNGVVRFQSPSISGLLGLEPAAVEHLPFSLLVHPEDERIFNTMMSETASFPQSVFTAEIRLRHADATWRTVEIVTSNLTENASIGGYVLTSRDVTIRNELTAQIAFAATHDLLTGLPNRRLLLDRLTNGLARANRSSESLAVIFTDLDKFKAVNDTYGHDAGDDLLRMAAKRILISIRPGDTLARLGGDEFVVLLESTRLDQAFEVAERVATAITRPFDLVGDEVKLSISLGIAGREGPLDEADDLLRRADVAMYSSKRLGHGSPVVYDHSMASDPISRYESQFEPEVAGIATGPQGRA